MLLFLTFIHFHFSRYRYLAPALFLVSIGLVPAFAWANPVEQVEVTAKGQGINPEEALRAAKRVALELGGAAEIASRSEVQNFALIRDTIYSRVDGIVIVQRILEEGPIAGGGYFCKIVAHVSASAIASTWAEVQSVLDQIGRPGIMVAIREEIDGRPEASSILESRIKEKLTQSGFDVYSAGQLAAIRSAESSEAAQEGNSAKVQALAKDAGAQIFIIGVAQANAAGVEDLYGVPTALYNGDVAVEMFYTDTGLLIASESEPNWRGGARGHHALSKQAGKSALSNAGERIVTKVHESCMRFWATRISSGAEVRFELEGVDLKTALEIKTNLLMFYDAVTQVNGPELTKGIATFRITSKVPAEGLAERILKAEWAKSIEIVDLKLHRIQGRYVQAR